MFSRQQSIQLQSHSIYTSNLREHSRLQSYCPDFSHRSLQAPPKRQPLQMQIQRQFSMIRNSLGHKLLQATEMMKPMSHISLLLLQPISQLWPQENTKLTIQFYLVPIFKLPSPFIFISHECVILELPYQTAYQTINFTFCNAIPLPTV